MRPILAMTLTQLFLLCSQQLPVVNRVRLLHNAHERCRLAFAFFHAHFAHLGQPTAEVVTPVAKVKLCPDIDDIALTQLRHATTGAFGLKFAEARFTGASGCSSRESAAGFGALANFRHFFEHPSAAMEPFRKDKL